MPEETETMPNNKPDTANTNENTIQNNIEQMNAEQVKNRLSRSKTIFKFLLLLKIQIPLYQSNDVHYHSYLLIR